MSTVAFSGTTLSPAIFWILDLIQLQQTSFFHHNYSKKDVPHGRPDIHAQSCFQQWKLKPNRKTGIVATLLGLLKPVMITKECLTLPVVIRQVIV